MGVSEETVEDSRQVTRKKKELYPDMRKFSRKKKEYGYLDTKACIVRIHCGKMKYDHDCARFYADMLPVGYTTTFFHELTHYYQAVTTTNGMYLLMLEDYQVMQTTRLKSVLKDLSYPFIGNMLAERGAWDAEADRCLYRWYSAELLKCLLGCDIEKYNFLAADTVFSGKKLSEIVCQVEQEICREFGLPYISRRLNDEPLKLPDDINEVIEKSSSPFENHARMAEYWWCGKSYDNPFGAGCTDLYEYSGWIRVFARYVTTADFTDFVASFMAVCELAQFAPLLPGIEGVKERSVYDYFPMYRMGRLIECAKEIPPVEGINDYNRYVNQLAQAAGYTQVTHLCRQLLINRWQEEGTYFWSDLFYKAVKIRSENFSAFFNYGFWHPWYQKIEPFAEYFLKLMRMPMLVFDDYIEIKSVQGNWIVFWESGTDGKEELAEDAQKIAMQVVVRDIFRQYFYTIMTGWGSIEKKVVQVECPVPADESLRKIIERETKEYIDKRFGFSPLLCVTEYRG